MIHYKFNNPNPTFPLNNTKTKKMTTLAFLSKAKTLKPNSNFFTLLRCMSNVPENTVYGGPKNQNPNQRVTLTHLRQKHRQAQPITVVTAYDYPSAVHLDTAGIDVCLVGDSASMVVHGHDTTLPISLDEMLVHCRAVARGAQRPLLVGDLPFGTYESSTSQVLVVLNSQFLCLIISNFMGLRSWKILCTITNVFCM